MYTNRGTLNAPTPGRVHGMGRPVPDATYRANGHDVRADEEFSVNDRVAALQPAIWDDATTLRHELQNPS
jgi:hypothetical protein